MDNAHARTVDVGDEKERSRRHDSRPGEPSFAGSSGGIVRLIVSPKLTWWPGSRIVVPSIATSPAWIKALKNAHYSEVPEEWEQKVFSALSMVKREAKNEPSPLLATR